MRTPHRQRPSRATTTGPAHNTGPAHTASPAHTAGSPSPSSSGRSTPSPAPLLEIFGQTRNERPAAAVAKQRRRAPLPGHGALSEGAQLSLSNDRQELLCSVIGLLVKLGLVVVTGVSLYRLAGAYQARLDRQGEIAAVIELEAAKLAKARQRFDQLFIVDGEQSLIREQSQWIAPNRMRVIWKPQAAFPTVETAAINEGKPATNP